MRSATALHSNPRAAKRLCGRVAVLIMLTVLPLACEHTATSPSRSSAPTAPPAFNMQGTWQGQYLEIDCKSSTCPVCCSSRGKIPAKRVLQLRVTQEGAAVTGLWEEEPLQFSGTLRGNISGQVSGAGVQLDGLLYPVASVISPVPPPPEPWTLKEFKGQLSDDGTTINASFVLASVDWRGRETMRLVNDLPFLNRVK